MAQIAGFDSTVASAGLGTEARQQDSAPDASRVTPVADGEAQRPDRQPNTPEETASEFEGRVAFTTKFGPDETGFPLQLVRGDELEAAVNLDIQALQNSPLSSSNNDVVIRAQESEQGLESTSTQSPTAQGGGAQVTVETSGATPDTGGTTAAGVTQTTSTTSSGGGTPPSDPGSVVDVQV